MFLQQCSLNCLFAHIDAINDPSFQPLLPNLPFINVVLLCTTGYFYE